MILNLFRSLGVKEGDLVYLHTSYSRIKTYVKDPRELIDTLLRLLGPRGTLVMPAFTWHLLPNERPWKGYKVFLNSRPDFDVAKSIPNIGLLPLIFWEMRGSMRSAHPVWSVTAYGEYAEYITRGQHLTIEPYGPGSSFIKLKKLGAIIMGLGVTLNTSSLCPMVDYELGVCHTQNVFTQEYIPFHVRIDQQTYTCATRTLQSKVVRYIQPSTIFKRSKRAGTWLRFSERKGAYFFAYPYEDYHRDALELAHACMMKREKMPWLERIPLKNDIDLTETA